MSRRLQVLVDEAELAVLREAAEREGLNLSAWSRRVLGEAARRKPSRSAARKLEAVRAAVENDFPAPDIEQMNVEISRGYKTSLPE